MIVELSNEGVARICHEVNRAYCKAIGDDSQPAWEDAPGWQKASACNGVGCRVKGQHPSKSHESWLKVKEADGWKYGPVKDAEKKEHPCMVPYDELPVTQQLKDSLFCAIVDKLRSY